MNEGILNFYLILSMTGARVVGLNIQQECTALTTHHPLTIHDYALTPL